MKKSLFYRILMAMVVFAIAGSACGTSPAGPNVPGAAIDVLGIMDKARTYYNGGVNQETDQSNLWQDYVQADSNLRLKVVALVQAAGMCFADETAAESTIGKAVMSNMDSKAIVSALVTNSVTGEQASTQCAGQFAQIGDTIVSGRDDVMNKWLMSYHHATLYQNYMTNFPEIQWENDLLQTYGDTTLLYEELAKHGIGVSDWSWLPTKNLQAQTTDGTLCKYYTSGAFMDNLPYDTKLKFTGHTDALARLYEAAWNPAMNGGTGLCTLYRYAALEFMMRQIVSVGTNQTLNTGVDQGLFPATPTVVPTP